MQFNGYHHIGLWVQDAERILAFYTKGLGGKIVFSFPMKDHDKTIYLGDLGKRGGGEYSPGNGAEEANAHWVHVAIRTDEARAAYELALKAGGVSKSAPQEMNLGAMQRFCLWS